MYNVSQDYIEASGAEARNIYTEALFNSETLFTGASTEGSIISIKLEEVMENSTGISMGTTGMSRAEITFYMPSSPLALTNGTIKPYAGLQLADGTIEYVPLGTFYNTEIQTHDDYTTVTVIAYDGMSRLADKYNTTITTWPASADVVLNDIATQTGITLGTITWPNIIPILTEYVDGSCRDYVGWIAGLLGCNAKFNRDGDLVFTYYSAEVNNTIIGRETQYLGGLEITTNDTIVIDSLTSGTENNPIISGTGVGITFTNPFMTQEILDGILAKVQGLEFTPLNCKWRGNPAIETGDVIFVTAKDDSNKIALVMEQTINITGGMFATLSCYGQTEIASQLNISPTEQKINKAYTDLMQAIVNASALINGARGGIFTITDNDNDGINDGWIITDSPDLSAAQKLIKANSAGIGISNNGGKSYVTAMTADGINATAISTGQMSAEHITVNGNTLSDFFDVSIDDDGHAVVRIGSSSNSIILKQLNDMIAFYDANNTLLAYWTNSAFEIVNLERFRLGSMALMVQPNSSISFVKAV